MTHHDLAVITKSSLIRGQFHDFARLVRVTILVITNKTHRPNLFIESAPCMIVFHK